MRLGYVAWGRLKYLACLRVLKTLTGARDLRAAFRGGEGVIAVVNIVTILSRNVAFSFHLKHSVTFKKC